MEQLIAFVEFERKHNPGKKHVAEWALERIEALQQAAPISDTAFDDLCMRHGFGAVARGEWTMVPRGMLKALVDAALVQRTTA